MTLLSYRTVFLLLLPLLPGATWAADLNGSQLSALWAVPFAGVLLSMALIPLKAPNFWHHHFGKVTLAWSLAFIVPFAIVFGFGMAGSTLWHAAVAEYIPFIVLLTALYTVAGGIHIRGNLHGTPMLNTGLLAIGAVLASVMGTTGASMLMIRPLIRANDNRIHRAHIVVFFIFIVANAGGSLTPLGDPPLFLGFLKGVDFSWTVKHIFPETAFLLGSLLVLFCATAVSLKLTPALVHKANQFSWGPMQEVAKLFAGIFLTIVPVIAMLKAGVDGPFSGVVMAVTRPDGTPDPAMYFWASGLLSSFLDNAPTYLVFFNTAGGDPQLLMTTLAPTLAAISAGSVFMGANTYIGNAPNLMVKAIAEERGVKMPGFFGYMAWSCAVLVPLFILMTFIWFR